MYSAGITSVLMRERREMGSVLYLVFVCAPECWWSVLCVFARAHKESPKVHRFAGSIGFPPPSPSPRTHSCVWINGANGGFDRTNSHRLMSHTDHWMFLMFQLKKAPRCEVCKHSDLMFPSFLTAELD